MLELKPIEPAADDASAGGRLAIDVGPIEADAPATQVRHCLCPTEEMPCR